MRIEQFVMAYGVSHDLLRSVVPDGFVSLRPVLRINAELRGGDGYIEYNTAAYHAGKKGWLNIGHWDGVPFRKSGSTVTFETDFLTVSFTHTGLKGSCPAERDNDGCFFIGETPTLRPPETVKENKEFCDCEFAFRFGKDDAHGVSIGKTLPAIPEDIERVYPKLPLTPENAAALPCLQVLGSYAVSFERDQTAHSNSCFADGFNLSL